MGRARAEAEQAARATAALAASGGAEGGAPGGETEEQRAAAEAAAAASERARERLATELETVRQHTLSKEQIEVEAIQRRAAILANAHEAGLVNEARFQELLAETMRRGQDQLSEIAAEGLSERQKFEQLSAQQKAATVLGNISAITAGVAGQNKTLFKIQKAAALAHAAVALPPAIIESFKNNGGWPWGAVAAAAMTAAGLAQIAAIRSTSLGGGTTPSLAGSGGSIGGQPVPVQPALPTLGESDSARRQVRVEIVINGDVVGSGGAEQLTDVLVENIRDRLENRDEVIFTRTSRQASEFTA